MIKYMYYVAVGSKEAMVIITLVLCCVSRVLCSAQV
jgi:hypothetical protein